MKQKLFIIISSVLSALLIITSITFLCVSSAINDERCYADGVNRYGFELNEIVIKAKSDIVTVIENDQSYEITDEVKVDDIIKSLDLSIWYRCDSERKLALKVVFKDKDNKTYKITLCEDNVIYYDGKYFVNDDGSIFHDTVVNAIA